MDKAQKQLIDTYFRKRNIATQNSENGGDYYRAYEVSVFNVHPEWIDKIDRNSLSSRDKRFIAMLHPEYINKFDFSALNYGDFDFVFKQPEKYADIINPNNFSNDMITTLIRWRPSLINKVDPEKLKELGDENIANIIRYRPELTNYFDMKKISGYQTIRILYEHPELIDIVNIQNIVDDDEYESLKHLLNKHPQLRPYFEK